MKRLVTYSVNSEILKILIQTIIGRVLSPDNGACPDDGGVQDPTNTQSYNCYSYCLNNPLRYTDPSGWFAAAADQYWNMGKDITDFISFSGRRASSADGTGGGQGWGGNGGVVPSGMFDSWSSWAVNLDTKENTNYWGQLVGSIQYMPDGHQILYGSGKDQHGLYYFDFRDKDAIDRKQKWQDYMAEMAASNIGYGKGDLPSTFNYKNGAVLSFDGAKYQLVNNRWLKLDGVSINIHPLSIPAGLGYIPPIGETPIMVDAAVIHYTGIQTIKNGIDPLNFTFTYLLDSYYNGKLNKINPAAYGILFLYNMYTSMYKQIKENMDHDKQVIPK